MCDMTICNELLFISERSEFNKQKEPGVGPKLKENNRQLWLSKSLTNNSPLGDLFSPRDVRIKDIAQKKNNY